MNCILLHFVAIVAFVSCGIHGQDQELSTGPTQLSCYICDSDDPGCEDTFSPNNIEITDCSTLDYDSGNDVSRSAVSKKPAYSNSVLKSVFNNEKKTRTLNEFYNCIKVKWTNSDGSITLDRTCVKLNSSIKDACEFIKAEINDDSLKMKSCNVCKTDKCNAATNLNSSVLVSIIIGFFVMKFSS
ncbi:PREDICTED: uncharacterized protein LOC108567020 [Nicrophorus vespilloides]|uniref:Uncharacterized protein LOC108567020 n=1 Tax=Nicrophorus vespilloides TaxID=110193 RepID=A0ABM1N793_NICVS|nr:PREDICTED: uncharacterized protein LOC108567020 [Nicrophorus vespilloides]